MIEIVGVRVERGRLTHLLLRKFIGNTADADKVAVRVEVKPGEGGPGGEG